MNRTHHEFNNSIGRICQIFILILWFPITQSFADKLFNNLFARINCNSHIIRIFSQRNRFPDAMMISNSKKTLFWKDSLLLVRNNNSGLKIHSIIEVQLLHFKSKTQICCPKSTSKGHRFITIDVCAYFDFRKIVLDDCIYFWDPWSSSYELNSI